MFRSAETEALAVTLEDAWDAVLCALTAWLVRDDPLLFGPRLVEQYRIAREVFGFSDPELAELAGAMDSVLAGEPLQRLRHRHAPQHALEAFQRLPYKNKICFSRHDYLSPVNCQLEGYVDDGARLFTQCFREVDMLEWFRSGNIRPNFGVNSVVNPFIGRFLKTSLH